MAEGSSWGGYWKKSQELGSNESADRAHDKGGGGVSEANKKKGVGAEEQADN